MTTGRDRPVPPGELIDAGGLRLHLHREGQGRLPVVFEAAMWDLGLTWALVGPEVARFTLACVYDRGGLGWSDPSPRPRHAEAMTEELRALLDAAEVPAPRILVAHSSSGILARVAAHRWPEEVAGLVLVDGAHEEQLQRFPETIRRAQDRMWEQQRATLLTMRQMLEAGTFEPSAIPVSPQLPEEAASASRALMASTVAVDTMLRELADLERLHGQAREAAMTDLGDLPMVVIRHGAPPPPFPEELGIGPDDMEAYEDRWVELQEEIAARSTRGRVVVAEGAGHMIQHERPDLVVSAIREVVEEAKGRIGGGQPG